MIIKLLFPLLWFTLLFILLIYFLRVRVQLNKPRYWQKASGKVTQFVWTQKEGFLWANVEYQYLLGEISYVGRRLFLPSHFYSPRVKKLRQALYRIALAYDADEEIPVYYVKDNPNEAVLIRFIPQRLNLMITLLIVLLVFHISSYLL